MFVEVLVSPLRKVIDRVSPTLEDPPCREEPFDTYRAPRMDPACADPNLSSASPGQSGGKVGGPKCALPRFPARAET